MIIIIIWCWLFFQILFDSNSRGYWLNELALLIHNEVETGLRLQMLESLMLSLDNCSDAIQIADQSDHILYQNATAERLAGYSLSELSEKQIWDFQSTTGLYDLVLNENNEVSYSPTILSIFHLSKFANSYLIQVLTKIEERQTTIPTRAFMTSSKHNIFCAKVFTCLRVSQISQPPCNKALDWNGKVAKIRNDSCQFKRLISDAFNLSFSEWMH